MLIAIISDIHDNLSNLDTCLTWCKQKKITKIICCGDICNSDTLKFLSANFSGEIFLVSGNGETFADEDFYGLDNIKYRQEIAVEKIDELTLGFCHQDKQIEEVIKKSGNFPDFIFYGHSHKPWLEKRNNMFIVNPGNISGTFFQATFAILNTENKKLELKIIHDLRLS
jgi:putative phosphoesterase